MKDKIRKYIMESILLGSVDQPIADNDSFLEKGILDSTSILGLVAFVEKEFQITVEDDELIAENFDSIGKLAAFTENKIGRRKEESLTSDASTATPRNHI